MIHFYSCDISQFFYLHMQVLRNSFLCKLPDDSFIVMWFFFRMIPWNIFQTLVMLETPANRGIERSVWHLQTVWHLHLYGNNKRFPYTFFFVCPHFHVGPWRQKTNPLPWESSSCSSECLVSAKTFMGTQTLYSSQAITRSRSIITVKTLLSDAYLVLF